MKPTLKAPGSKRLKLKCDEPLTIFAIKFNLRRYNKNVALSDLKVFKGGGLFSMSASMFANVTTFDRKQLTLEYLTLVLSLDLAVAGDAPDKPLLALGGTLNFTYPCKRGMVITGTDVRGRAVQVNPIKPTLKAPGSKRLKLEHEKLLSDFAYNFNLRRYSVVR